jgi:hypothetical protein
VTETPTTTYRDIRGWFSAVDHQLFTGLLAGQQTSPPGDLVEIGTFLGKSAVVIGEHLRADERFVVIDLFGDLSLLGEGETEEANRAENAMYRRLTRDKFEQNYLSIHDELPVVVQAPSSEIMEHVEPGSVRFVHVDASHLYEPVAEDCRSVKKMLRAGGVAAFDDWRNASCPGVAAAIWESVVTDGLVPVAVSQRKLYAAHEGADQVASAVRELVDTKPDWWVVKEHQIMGHTVLGLDSAAAVRRRGARRAARSGRRRGTDQHAQVPAQAARSLRSVARDLVPPALVRRVQRRRS